ncbi:AraC family transcriptional regulator [Rhodopseudomonas thermotolerans]|uniref:AraC family transcriptional regulator n=2 Tax=Rhodopseudomonas TaxID=1073 RepID=A0A336JNB9_9BRAD|nr:MULTISPECIES: AraC family transcriptional regulator [Rhodopseudomonas]RED33181.1 AraC family transcriptional regulator [Rhodopseudomonas pentothenatexigens]REF93930.1 AraC family transcriptional regulator [Rhodopseudomonas thermotolerans]SSW91257.1 AraC family transcriptional regulator [Rhodopseudomonas pentothenatexigens]
MTASAYGHNLGRRLRSDQAPALTTHSLHSTELAVTECRNDAPEFGLSGSLPGEDAYLVSLKLRDYSQCECWEEGRPVITADVHSGATYLYDLRRDPRYVINKPFHSVFFYLPRTALNAIGQQAGTRRVGDLAYQPGIGSNDDIVRHISASLLAGLHRPHEVNQLFVDHLLLAIGSHVIQTYGGLDVSGPVRGGLAAWQTRRACELLAADLEGKLSLQRLAAEFGLSTSHFSRAFRISTGLPPHRWLMEQRVSKAKQLLSDRKLPLSEVAIAAGFANQSHLTRVFSSIAGISPGAWRRESGSR